MNRLPAKPEIQDGEGASRRQVLECMAWAGTGLLWSFAGGVPAARLITGAAAAETKATSFIQLSDSHIGFDKAANPDATATLREAVAKVKALKARPQFMIHTGDITHLSKPKEFDDAATLLGETGLEGFYVPGEHDVIDEGLGKAYLERYRRPGTQGAGWFAFDVDGVHFVGLVNVLNLKAGGLGFLGDEQLAWLERDLKGRPTSTPIVVFAHVPLWAVYAAWGWGTDDGARALALLQPFGSVTVLNGHIHQIVQKVEGHMTFHTARSTAFPQPQPGQAPSPGPMVVPAEQLRTYLGLTSVSVRTGDEQLAIVDTTLAAAT